VRPTCEKITRLMSAGAQTLKRLRLSAARASGRLGTPSGLEPDAVPAARVLTLNIAAAAEARAARILRWLRGRSDDVIVLSETSAGTGTELIRRGLEADGFTTYSAAHERDRGVLIATRLPVREELGVKLSVTLPWRAQAVVLDSAPHLAVIGVYVPSRDRSPEKVERKRKFITSLLESIRSLPEGLRSRLLLVGDYNAVAREHVPPLPGFFPYEYAFHEELAELGLSAAHQLKPYGGHPHSWIGRTGIGYLYDYAHVGDALGSRLRRCQYLHGPRRQRLSDHAALALQVRLG
jgi:exodeoxyribonuclease-3